MRTSLFKYQVGLAALGGLVLIALIIALAQAAGTRSDKLTETKSQEIANKLNDYTGQKNEVPADLATAGVKDVPATITYKKLSDTRYTFCATYKAASDNSFTVGITDVLSGGALSGTGSDTSFDESFASTESEGLYIYSHKKGENCQTVKIYDPGASTADPDIGSLDSCEYNFSVSDADNQAYYDCLSRSSQTRFN
ncbi:MAG TPA: hypothetical protein VF575_00340 [Candidatus Saccharimonadales bacterium]|jgi:hypothetical protein